MITIARLFVLYKMMMLPCLISQKVVLLCHGKSFASVIKYIGNSKNNCVMYLLIKCDNFNICVCNVYMPCFEHTTKRTEELIECFAYIDHVFDMLTRANESVKLCIKGDYNVDIQRMYDSLNTKCIRDFSVQYDLSLSTMKLEDEVNLRFLMKQERFFYD